MQVVRKEKLGSPSPLAYLATGDHKERILHLRAMRDANQSLPLSLVDDLLCLDLPETEKRQLLRVADQSDPIAFEDFLTRSLPIWDQNLSAHAMHLWARGTDHVLWGRLLSLLTDYSVPQRIFYILLDYAWDAGGKSLLQSAVGVPAIDEFSERTLALLFHRLVQWSLYDPDMMHLAEKMAVKTLETPFPSGAALPFAVEYLARFKPEQLENLLNNPVGHKAWGDVVKPFVLIRNGAAELEQRLLNFFDDAPARDSDFYLQLMQLWPPCWLRHRMSENVLIKAFAAVGSRALPQELATPPGPALTWEFFAGFPEDVLYDALLGISEDRPFGKLCSLLGSLLPVPFGKKLEKKLARVETSAATKPWRSDWTVTVRGDEIDQATRNPSTLKSPTQVKGWFLSRFGLKESFSALDPQTDDRSRRAFFDVAFRQKTVLPEAEAQGPWVTLHRAILNPAAVSRPEVCKTGLSLAGVFIPAFFRTLEQFAGYDDVVPALSNYLHTTEESELAPLLRALDGINTSQSDGYLVRFLGRETVSPALKLEISQMLSGKDLTHQQPELRDLVRELSAKSLTFTSQQYQLLDAIRSLLVTDAEGDIDSSGRGSSGGALSESTPTLTKSALDHKVSEMIAAVDKLPRESLRALRTAVLILHTIKERRSIEGVDISPAVDMQYKALEILFRALFEESTLRLVQSGMLQRKLDVLGYARPFKSSMDEFENYVSSLPVIQDIPIFSKFKLNKILRAIALYRPGRRFTLDGLKAYGLFFLVFGRQECKYRLERLYDVKFKQDDELMAFCRDLHLFQDIRNRAVHEGLPVQALSDVEALWNLTSSLIDRAYKLR